MTQKSIPKLRDVLEKGSRARPPGRPYALSDAGAFQVTTKYEQGVWSSETKYYIQILNNTFHFVKLIPYLYTDGNLYIVVQKTEMQSNNMTKVELLDGCEEMRTTLNTFKRISNEVPLERRRGVWLLVLQSLNSATGSRWRYSNSSSSIVRSLFTHMDNEDLLDIPEYIGPYQSPTNSPNQFTANKKDYLLRDQIFPIFGKSKK